MSDITRRYLIAYDIPDDHRRSQISSLLQKYGNRVQYSVFVIDIKPARFIRMKTALLGILDLDDSVLVCDLGPLTGISTDQFSYLGAERTTFSPGWVIA